MYATIHFEAEFSGKSKDQDFLLLSDWPGSWSGREPQRAARTWRRTWPSPRRCWWTTRTWPSPWGPSWRGRRRRASSRWAPVSRRPPPRAAQAPTAHFGPSSSSPLSHFPTRTRSETAPFTRDVFRTPSQTRQQKICKALVEDTSCSCSCRHEMSWPFVSF